MNTNTPAAWQGYKRWKYPAHCGVKNGWAVSWGAEGAGAKYRIRYRYEICLKLKHHEYAVGIVWTDWD